jgi:Bacterial membrane protein YfhO
MAAATLPFVSGLSASRIFYIRDLSMFFWGQHVFLRRSLLSGTFPLWDPYVGAGQSAAADALRQMFLPPALALRLIGGDVFSFNLWVMAPFPLAALGAWLFFRRRFSTAAAALGALAFAVSGPIVSTSNFPNLSWSIAAMPWLLWTADRLATRPTSGAVVAVAAATACQALAGEPVTLLTTLALVAIFVLVINAPLPAANAMTRRLQHLGMVAIGIGLGLGVAAIQLVPLASAATLSARAGTVANDFWSVHPLALAETVSLHLFGDHYTAQHLQAVPWLPLVNSGREPFLFSIYIGVPLLALALLGLLSRAPERWGWFWLAAGAASLIGAFGAHTPVYPFLRDHLPLLSAFRYPAKYMVLSSMAVAAGAAAGWDALARHERRQVHSREATDGARFERARLASIGTALTIGGVALVAAAACMYVPTPTAFRLFAIAQALGAADPVSAAEFMFKTLPSQASLVLLLSAATAVLLWLAAARRKEATAARWLLGALIVADLIVRASGVNPTLDAAYLAEPAWLAYTRADSNARIYIGSKREGTLDSNDLDASGPIRNPPGLVGAASRAALNGELNFVPSAWHSREMLSDDLPILWPRRFAAMTKRFLGADGAARDLFLDRTGVRYRILPAARAGGRAPLTRVPYLFESYLYDWGPRVSPRVAVVQNARVVPDADTQMNALFESGWDANAVALVEREPSAEGTSGPPATPAATIAADGLNRVLVNAAAGAAGGYLVMRDSYAADWRVRVDAQPASMVRADGLFRAVHLTSGAHTIEFTYRPRALFTGLAVSAAALLILLVLLAAGFAPGRRRGGSAVEAARA